MGTQSCSVTGGSEVTPGQRWHSHVALLCSAGSWPRLQLSESGSYVGSVHTQGEGGVHLTQHVDTPLANTHPRTQDNSPRHFSASTLQCQCHFLLFFFLQKRRSLCKIKQKIDLSVLTLTTHVKVSFITQVNSLALSFKIMWLIFCVFLNQNIKYYVAKGFDFLHFTLKQLHSIPI